MTTYKLPTYQITHLPDSFDPRSSAWIRGKSSACAHGDPINLDFLAIPAILAID
jgi:hypothetical protein